MLSLNKDQQAGWTQTSFSKYDEFRQVLTNIWIINIPFIPHMQSVIQHLLQWEGTLSIIQRLWWLAFYSDSHFTVVHILQWFTLYNDSLFTVIHTLQWFTIYSESQCTVIHNLQWFTLSLMLTFRWFSLYLEGFTPYNESHATLILTLQWSSLYLEWFTLTASHTLH